MAVLGGDVIEISFNHPTLGDGKFFPKSGEDSTFETGGFRGNDDANMVDGAGRTIRQLNRVRWSIECTIAWDMNIADEYALATALAGDPAEADYTITHSNGTVWAGKGAPVGDIQPNGNAATFTLKIAGGGVMEKISG